MKKISGKCVLVTGAASGIGRLMALGFAAEGAKCVICDINEKGLGDVKKEIEKSGAQVKAYACDISDEKSVEAALKKIDSENPQLDILVNNAGIVLGKNVLDLSISDYRKTMDVNFFGHLLFTKHYLPGMVKRNSGHIVNISSSAGLQGFPRGSDYNASKFAEVGFTEALRLELKKMGCKGVKTTLVCPYVIDTGMFKGFKPLILNPLLKADYVSKRVIKAVKQEAPILKMPFSINLTLMLKLFPVGFSDWVMTVMGMTSAMDGFKGRKG
jgi:all-trans-retinol dehydrogenase (NAD+)